MIPLPCDLNGHIAIIGSGIGGLITALALAPHSVTLITKTEIGGATSSMLAQGGIAASLGADDSAMLHLDDTLAAGDGICDDAAAMAILSSAPEAIAFLERHGVVFDRNETGAYAFGIEAAHTRRRILHAAGDGSGASIVNALVAAVHATPSITIIDETEVRRLLASGNEIRGLLCVKNGQSFMLSTSRVVLATGGLGGLYDASTNPTGNFGQGIMLAARAGAMLTDMEFVQFHPTALMTDITPRPLISEAVRGEGAILINSKGERFLDHLPAKEMAPRDIVTRAIMAEISSSGKVYLDARKALGTLFPDRFPAITAICAKAGIDPITDLIPVRPAEHYHMGGVATDTCGQTSVCGLWAVGECAATGLHGANRLASNSLLEACVMALNAARDIAASPASSTPLITDQPAPPTPHLNTVRSTVSRHLGILRDQRGLRAAISELLPLVKDGCRDEDPAIVALAIAVFAYTRAESRGGHARQDFPGKKSPPTRQAMKLADVLYIANALNRTVLARSA